MKAAKVKRLANAGWRVGSAKDFLALSTEEAALVEMHLALSKKLRQSRAEAGLSQSQLATRMGSSQSRIAKMEAADPTVTLDLLIRSLLALGTSPKDIGRALAP